MSKIKSLVSLVSLVSLSSCQMDMGKITEYEQGQITKTTETRSKASTVQSVTTVFGVRIKTLAPAGSDMAPVELDLGLARNAMQVVPMGEKASIKTNWGGILWWDENKLINELKVGQ